MEFDVHVCWFESLWVLIVWSSSSWHDLLPKMDLEVQSIPTCKANYPILDLPQEPSIGVEAKSIARAVGSILEEDCNVRANKDPRFYVAIDPLCGYVSKISVANIINQFSKVTVGYDINKSATAHGHDLHMS